MNVLHGARRKFCSLPLVGCSALNTYLREPLYVYMNMNNSIIYLVTYSLSMTDFFIEGNKAPVYPVCFYETRLKQRFSFQR